MKKITNNLFMLKIIFQCCPSHIFFSIFVSITSSALSIANILLTKYIIDSVSSAERFTRVLFYILVILVVNIISIGINTIIASFILPKNTQKLHRRMQTLLFQKAMCIEFKLFEDSDFFNRFNLAMSQADSRAIAVLNTFSSFLSVVFTVAGLFAIISGLSGTLIIIALTGVALTIGLRFLMAKTGHDFTVQTIPTARKKDYIRRIIYLREYMQEIRLHKSSPDLIDKKLSDNTDEFICLIRRFQFKRGIPQLCGGIVSESVSAASMIYLAFQVFYKSLSIGNFVALSTSCLQLFNQTSSLFGIIYQLYEHGIYIEHFRGFLELESEDSSAPKTELLSDAPSISLSDISFSYGDGKAVLSSINLCIPYGQKVALIGDNGSGKSTLIKMLAHLYRPDAGMILIDGKPIESYDRQDLLSGISVVLQDSKLFAFSIMENILMRPVIDAEEDERVVKEALEYVGMLEKIEQLPEGIYTKITKEFSDEGTFFSGGEYQKLSIARAYANKPRIMILDEPLNSLDKKSSEELTRKIIESESNRTVIIVTHNTRILSKMDKVYLLEAGSIKDVSVNYLE